MHSAPHPSSPSAPREICALLALAVLIALLHGRSIHYGLFMDDYAHIRQLREADWSVRGLTAACRLDLVPEILDAWWLPEIRLRFFRPVSFALMKLTYALAGWNPAAMHVASMSCHLAVCALTMYLLRFLAAPPLLAWVAAALLAIHPTSVSPVQWIACQTELMVAAFLLAATLCWARFRAWTPGPAPAPPPTPATPPAESAPTSPQRHAWLWAVAALACFTAALGCRENAVLFPLVMFLMEPFAARTPRGRHAWRAYLAPVLIAGVYLAARAYYLGGAALPPRPYVVPPTAPDFLPYIFDKLCYYTLALFALVPCVPFGGLQYLRDIPALFYGASLAILAATAWVAFRPRRRPENMLGLAWFLVFVAPVLPAFESPHHLYLPGVGWTIVVSRIFAALGGRHAWTWRIGIRGGLALSGAVGLGLLFALMTHLFGLAMDTAQAVEDRVVDEVASDPEGLRDGDTLYFANLPMIAHYVRYALEEYTGRRNLHAVALTWAPRLLGMAGPAELDWLSDRELEIRVAGDRYFAGPMGALTRQATGRSIPLRPGTALSHGRMQISVSDADDQGISALRFAFPEPPDTGRSHLYWGSTTRWAQPINR